MKHVRNLKPDRALDDLQKKRSAEKHHILEDHGAGPKIFQGVIVALPASLSLWAVVLYVVL